MRSSSSVVLEANVSDGGELPALWPASRSGERKDLDQDVGCCDQDGASGAVPAEQRTGEATPHLTMEGCRVHLHSRCHCLAPPERSPRIWPQVCLPQSTNAAPDRDSSSLWRCQNQLQPTNTHLSSRVSTNASASKLAGKLFSEADPLVFHSEQHRREVGLLKPSLVLFPSLISQSRCRKLPFHRLGLMLVPWLYTSRKGGGMGLVDGMEKPSTYPWPHWCVLWLNQLILQAF